MRVESNQDDRVPTLGVSSLSDDELLRRLTELVRRSRRVEAEVVAHIAEVDERKLYAREASPSMFTYCTDVLHLSEPEAYLRISVARAGRAYPVLLAMLRDGRLHLSGIAKLAPHLTAVNVDAVLARAAHRSKRQIEELVAELAPQPDAPAVVRKLPQPRQASAVSPALLPAPSATALELRPDGVPPAQAAAARSAIVQPTAPARYKVQFTASAEFRAKLDQLVALMRHAAPHADLAAILEDAVTEKLRRLEARKFARSDAPRKDLASVDTSASRSRYVPAPVRRATDGRDGGRCGFLAPNGKRCPANERLEFHHGQPHARGGNRSVDNIQLMCRTHNVYLAERDFGKAVMARYRRKPGGKGPASTRH